MTKMTKKLLESLLFAIVLSASNAVYATIALDVTASPNPVDAGSNVTVDIRVPSAINDVDSVFIALDYDETVLTPVSASGYGLGSVSFNDYYYFGTFGEFHFIPGFGADAFLDVLSLGGIDYVANDLLVSVIFSVDAGASGSTVISILESDQFGDLSYAEDIDFNFIDTFSGSETIRINAAQQGETPVPAVFSLLCIGLAGLWSTRRKKARVISSPLRLYFS